MIHGLIHGPCTRGNNVKSDPLYICIETLMFVSFMCCVCTPAHVLPYSTPWPVYLELDAIEMSAASEIAGAEALDAAGAAVVTLESVRGFDWWTI